MNETLLLTATVNKFRKRYPELIAQWEERLSQENYNPDFHFCLALMDDFPKLKAYLSILDYRFDFVINAYIIHSNYERDFIASGYDYGIALEMANREIRLTYKALATSETIAKDPKVEVYHNILIDTHRSDL